MALWLCFEGRQQGVGMEQGDTPHLSALSGGGTSTRQGTRRRTGVRKTD